jgi:hypothetical protein
VRYAQPKYAHPRLSAKYYKLLSHLVLPEYDEVLWIDPNFARDVFEYLKDASMALCLHPERGCIYDEANLCQPMAKYCDQNIMGQVAHYREEGFPAKWGLFAAGIIARRNNDPKIRHLNEACGWRKREMDVPRSAQSPLCALEIADQTGHFSAVSLEFSLGSMGAPRPRAIEAGVMASVALVFFMAMASFFVRSTSRGF